jgi:hypothetical protein
MFGLIMSIAMMSQAPAEAAYLDDLTEVSVKVGRGELGKHGSYGFGNAAVEFKGKSYPHALSAHPFPNGFSSVVYDLKGRNQTFTGTVSLGDAGDKPESLVSFEVLGDSRVLWQSRPIDQKGISQQFAVKLTGVRRLELRTKCQGGNGWAVGVWLEPRLEGEEPWASPAPANPVLTPNPSLSNPGAALNDQAILDFVRGKIDAIINLQPRRDMPLLHMRAGPAIPRASHSGVAFGSSTML